MITLNTISKQFGGNIIFDQCSVTIHPQQCTGLVGLNGTGKTLLLKTLAGQEKVDTGEVVIPSDLRLGYLPQEMDIKRSISPFDMVLEPFSHLFKIESVTAEMAACTDHKSAEFKQTMKNYETLHNEMEIHDVYSLKNRAKAILTGLGIPEKTWENCILNLSGGFHMRVLLAQLLLCNLDFLLLDEPTNHLDMDSLIWFEKFLKNYAGGILVVSHDRDFLNRITTHTMEISKGKIIKYTGNIKAFLEWKITSDETEQRRLKNLQSKITKTERFITRFKSKNTKASQARSKMKQLEKLKEKLPEQRTIDKALHFKFSEPGMSGYIPIKLENISVSYNRVKVFSDISLTVTRGDKIAIIGPNGAGKSTLLKVCMNLLKPQSGTVTIGSNTCLQYYSQHRLEQLNPEKTVKEMFLENAGNYNLTHIQTMLGTFLFSGDDINKKVEYLSGGEKSRLSLAIMLAGSGNVLLFDEPTNHLDIVSIECLAGALHQFNGTVLIVSHDEYFLSRITNRIIELRPGAFRDFPGSFADYRSYIEEHFLETFSSQVSDQPVEKPDHQENDKQTRIRLRQEKKKNERRIEKIERKIEEIEQEIEATKAILRDPQNASNYQELEKTQKKLDWQRSTYEELLAEWELLHQELENFSE